MVGGAVRDILLGKEPKDADIAFNGNIHDFLALFPHAQVVGRSVKVIILDGREYMPLQGDDIIHDLHTRDITINAVAMPIHRHVPTKNISKDQCLQKLYAHPQALFDLQHGFLRPASPEAFSNDPLRIYRLARFAAQFPQFSLTEEAIHAGLNVTTKNLHTCIPSERVGRELCKGLICAKPSNFFITIHTIRALHPWFMELDTMDSEYFYAIDKINFFLKDNTIVYDDTLLLNMAFMMLCRNLTKQQVISLCQRLALSTTLQKSGLLMAQNYSQSTMFEELSMMDKCAHLMKIYASCLSVPYWLCMDIIHNSKVSSVRLAAEQHLVKVHLPIAHRNQGAASGQYLMQLRCLALETFYEQHIH